MLTFFAFTLFLPRQEGEHNYHKKSQPGELLYITAGEIPT